MTMCTYFGTLKLIIMIILWTSICLQDAQAIRNPFEVVQRCPFNESEWKVRAAHTTCNGSESYHCLLTEGGDSLREQCTDASLFTSGFCPIFTNEGYLQWSACKDTACPTSSYRSDEVYQYQICYKKTDNPKEKNTEKGSNDSSSVTGVTIIIVAILLAFVLLLVLVVFFYKRNQCGFKDKVQRRIVGIRTVFQHNNNTEGLQVRRHRQAQQLIRLVPKDGQARLLMRQVPKDRQARLPIRQVRKDGKARPPIRQVRKDGKARPPIRQGMKLNPDCTVEKGIVITENITTALALLKSINVVILKGVIGCGKTHALKAIQNHFQENNWETAWVWSENVEEEITYDKPTILLCDNLFGRFGSSEFTQYAVDEIERALKEMEHFRKTTKIVIGIHTHVYEEVKKTLKLRFLDQKSITVEMDNLSEAETLLIFKEQLKRGHCKLHSTCWFKCVGFQSVLEKLSKNQSDIGSPFLSLMYCNQHELFSDEAFSIDPVKTLVQYFLKMKHDSPELYYCLVYLMCVQQHNIEEEPEDWAGFIHAEVTKDNLRYLAKTSGLLQVENTIATFAHELLTTALFKSAAEEIDTFLIVLRACGTDIFLQLLRPKDIIPSDLYVESSCMYNESGLSKLCLKVCAYKLAKKYKSEKKNSSLDENKISGR